jgi:hypothetical protein
MLTMQVYHGSSRRSWLRSYITTPIVYPASGHHKSRLRLCIMTPDSGCTSQLRSYIPTPVTHYGSGRTSWLLSYIALTIPLDFGQLWLHRMTYLLVWWMASLDQTRWPQYLTSRSLSLKKIEFQAYDPLSAQNLNISRLRLFKCQAHVSHNQRTLSLTLSQRKPEHPERFSTPNTSSGSRFLNVLLDDFWLYATQLRH